MKAIIKKVSKGKEKGQFRFVLKGDNGKNLSPQDAYHNKQDLLDTLNKYFPNFQIIDNVK